MTRQDENGSTAMYLGASDPNQTPASDLRKRMVEAGEASRDKEGKDKNEDDTASTGRPRKPESEKRTGWLSFRVNEGEKERVEERAERTGKPVATFCREAALGVPMTTSEHRHQQQEKIRQLSKIGNNLNQLAKKANQGKGVHEEAILSTLKAVREAISEA